MVDAAAWDDQRVVELHGVGEAKIEPVLALGDHDRVAAAGREVKVVRVANRHRLTLRSPGDRADRRQAVADVVVDPKGLEVVRRGYMLGQESNGIVRNDLECPLVDYVDGVTGAVRDVDARRVAADSRAEVVRSVVRVDVCGRPRLRAVRGPVSSLRSGGTDRRQARQSSDSHLVAPAGDHDVTT